MLALAVATLSSAPAIAAPVTLRFWDLQWGNASYQVVAQQLVDRFNNEHPDIKVELTIVPWTNWFETFVTAVASGSAPDVSTGASFQPNYFHSQDAILPIDDLIEAMRKDGSLADIPEANLETYHVDGHYIALPWAVDFAGWYYRKDILEKFNIQAPTSWQELREAAKAVTGDGVYGIMSSGDHDKILITLLQNNDGGFFDEDGKPDLLSERNRETVEFLAALQADGSVDRASVGYDGNHAIQAFISGKAAFYLSGPSLLANADAETQAKIGILPPLAGPHGDKGTAAWNAGIMAYSQTQHPKEAMTFIRWWSENETPLWTKAGGGMLPVRASIRKDPFFTESPITTMYADQYLPVAKPIYNKAKQSFPELNAVEGDGFIAKTVQQIWQGKPVDQLLPAAQQRLEAIVNGQ
ncbi:sugar-binding protein [Kaistia sp. 32K]|nr:sugar-binding protein [Kaistia sp. 32K]